MVLFFFFNDTATTEIYTLSLHDALPILTHMSSRSTSSSDVRGVAAWAAAARRTRTSAASSDAAASSRPARRSEEHTSELQSRQYLVCRLLLEKKKTNHSMSYRLTPTLSR